MNQLDSLRIRLEGRLETLERGLELLTSLSIALRQGTELAALVEELDHLRARLDEALVFTRTREIAAELRQAIESEEVKVSALASTRAQVLGVSAIPAERLRALAGHFPLHFQDTFKVRTDRVTVGSVLKTLLFSLATKGLAEFQPYADRKAPLVLSSKVLVVDDSRIKLEDLAGFELRRSWGSFEPLAVLFKRGGRQTLPAGGYNLGLALERLGVPSVKEPEVAASPG